MFIEEGIGDKTQQLPGPWEYDWCSNPFKALRVHRTLHIRPTIDALEQPLLDSLVSSYRCLLLCSMLGREFLIRLAVRGYSDACHSQQCGYNL